MNEITIYTQGQPLAVKEYQGQRVITFKDVDALHQRAEGTARRNFNANRGRFIEGEDYFVRNSYEAKAEFDAVAPNGLVLLTKMGYLMLVKSFTDDLAWMVQRQLVKSYFEAYPAELSPAPVRALPEGKKPLPRIRTLPQAVKEIQAADPHSCITLNALRQWVKSGEVPSRKAGKNFLVDMDEVARHMGER